MSRNKNRKNKPVNSTSSEEKTIEQAIKQAQDESLGILVENIEEKLEINQQLLVEIQKLLDDEESNKKLESAREKLKLAQELIQELTHNIESLMEQSSPRIRKEAMELRKIEESFRKAHEEEKKLDEINPVLPSNNETIQASADLLISSYEQKTGEKFIRRNESMRQSYLASIEKLESIAYESNHPLHTRYENLKEHLRIRAASYSVSQLTLVDLINLAKFFYSQDMQGEYDDVIQIIVEKFPGSVAENVLAQLTLSHLSKNLETCLSIINNSKTTETTREEIQRFEDTASFTVFGNTSLPNIQEINDPNQSLYSATI